MTKPRKHHYLPQFYLRGFSTDCESIFQIEKETGKYYECSIKDTAAIRDFHEIDGEGVDDPNALEKALAGVESQQAEALSALLTDGVSNLDALGDIVGLLSMLRMRVPAVKKYLEQSLVSKVRAAAKAMERNGQLPKPPPGVDASLLIDDLQISVMNWKCLELMFSMSDNPEALNALGRMRATIYSAPENQHFFTSDQPVSLFHPTIRPIHPIGVGPAVPNVEITLPLSRTTLLMLDHGHGPHLEKVASAEKVVEFNRRTIITAQNYIFTGISPELASAQSRPLKDEVAGFYFDNHRVGTRVYEAHRFMPVNPKNIKGDA